MRFEHPVFHRLGFEHVLANVFGLGDPCVEVAELERGLSGDVALRRFVQLRSIGVHRLFGIEHRR